MKKVMIFVLSILLISCSTNNETTVTDLKSQIKYLEKEVFNKDEIINQKENMLGIIEKVNNIEIVGDNIYMINEDHLNAKQVIDMLVYASDERVYSWFESYHKADKISNFKVSDDSKYIVITSYDSDKYRFDMTRSDGSSVFTFRYNDFIEEIIQVDNLENEKIHILGFSKDDHALWGGIGGELDLLISFVYIIDDDKFIVFSEDKWDLYNKYKEKYPFE